MKALAFNQKQEHSFVSHQIKTNQGNQIFFLKSLLWVKGKTPYMCCQEFTVSIAEVFETKIQAVMLNPVAMDGNNSRLNYLVTSSKMVQ